MANLTSTLDILADALQKSGELQTVVSPYYAFGLTYLNTAYRDVISGTSVFAPDSGEPFVWAKTQTPGKLTLKAPYATGNVTLTNASVTGTLDTPPAYSLKDYWLVVIGRQEFYQITAHTAGAGTFTIDLPYADSTTTGAFKAHKLDYVIDVPFLIDTTNNKLDFKEGVGSQITATIASGSYSNTDDLVAAVNAALAAAAVTLTFTVSRSRKIITISATGAFQLLISTGTHATTSAFATLGFSGADVTGVTTTSGSELLSGIARLIEPFKVDRPQSFDGDGEGLIYGIDPMSFSRNYPRFALANGIPVRFTVIAESDGQYTIRMNKSTDVDCRVEYEFIPIPTDLTASANSIPVFPREDRAFLSYATTYHIMVDKSDPRADAYFRLAQTKLQSMNSERRREFAKTGSKTFGRLIPRTEQMQFALIRSASGLRF